MLILDPGLPAEAEGERLLDHFDRTWIIHLPDREDRRRQTAQELRRNGMRLAPGKVEFFLARRPERAAGFPSPAVRGCFASHLAVLRLARDLGLAHVLVMEDDVSFAGRLRFVEGALVRRLRREDWDVVYFGHREPLPATAPTPLCLHRGPVLLSHFYGMGRRGLERVVPFLEGLLTRPAGHPEGGPMHLDGALSEFRARHPELVTLLAHPSLAWQRPSRRGPPPDAGGRVPVVRGLLGLPHLTWATTPRLP